MMIVSLNRWIIQLSSRVHSKMFRLVGYFVGIIAFLVLGIQKVPAFLYFFICAILNLGALVLIIIFRLLAKYFHGFWRIWSKRLQKWISEALMCLGHYTVLPQYQITTVTINENGQKNIKKQRTFNTFLWGLLQMLICAALTGIAPLVVLFVLFCYAQSIFYECQFQRIIKEKNEHKQEMIARCSARLSLEVPLNDFSLSSTKNITTFRNTLASNYPIMQPVLLKNIERNSVNHSQVINHITIQLQQMQRNKQDQQEQQIKKQVIQLKEQKVNHLTMEINTKIQKIQKTQEQEKESVKSSVFKQQKMETKTESIQIQSINMRQDIAKIDNDEL